MNHAPYSSLARRVCPWNYTIECMHLHIRSWGPGDIFIDRSSIRSGTRRQPPTEIYWSIRFTMHACSIYVVTWSRPMCYSSVSHQTLYTTVKGCLLHAWVLLGDSSTRVLQPNETLDYEPGSGRVFLELLTLDCCARAQTPDLTYYRKLSATATISTRFCNYKHSIVITSRSNDSNKTYKNIK
jgi:hypothetical protein